MAHSYTKEELTEYFFEALDTFNACMDSDIDEDNVLLEFFTPANGVKVYESFCRAHFPNMLEENYKEPGYFESFGASAFLNAKEYGVLIREDIDFTLGEILQMFLHEISHLYCSRNEIEGGNFFDKYCMGSGVEDGMMNAGYAIWREAVADILADSIMSEYSTMTLGNVADTIDDLYAELAALIIVYIMISSEVAGTTDWEEAEKAIKKFIKIDRPIFITILKQVFEQLHRTPFWEITPEFIMTLGRTYLSLLAFNIVRGK